MTAPIPHNEPGRLAALRQYELLDTPPEAAFDEIARLAAKLLKTPIALVSLIDENRQWFKSRVGLQVRETSREDAFCAHAIHDDAVMVVEDAERDPRFRDNPLVLGDPKIRFYAGAPLVTSDGHGLGTVCIIDSQPRTALSPDEADTLKSLATITMALIETRRMLSVLNPTTGMASRNQLIEDLDRLLGDPDLGSDKIFVVAVDTTEPNAFLEVIRTLGYAYADEFMVASAKLLRTVLPADTKLYHIGSFRFVVLIREKAHTKLEDLLAAMVKRLKEPMQCANIPIVSNPSIGVAQFPRDGNGGIELLRAAIAASYVAQDSTGRWAAYDGAIDLAYQRAFRLLTDLPAALAADNQLALHYQPKLHLRTGTCVGAEALLRWRHPQLGMIPPGEFIPLTERTAHIKPVTEWVLATALKQLVRWRSRGLRTKISINVSIRNLEEADFPQRVAALLERYQVAPQEIEFEITESALTSNLDTARRQLQEIRRLGIDISIDDFGTGQSALAYLKNIPASIIKIDQTFVRGLATDPKDRLIVSSTIELAHRLGFSTTAEGIETQEAYDILRGLSCENGQGYLMSRPLDADAFAAWMERQTAEASYAPKRVTA